MASRPSGESVTVPASPSGAARARSSRAADLLLGERPEGDHPAAREEGGDDLEGRVLGGGADERHRPVLDVRQERVLLGLGEAVDLVHEEDGPLAVHLSPVPGRGHDLADLLHPAQDRAEGDELGAGALGHDAGQGGLSGARRPPQDQGGHLVRLDGPPQGSARPQHVLLAGEVLQAPGAHPLGEGLAGWVGCGSAIEEVHGHAL